MACRFAGWGKLQGEKRRGHGLGAALGRKTPGKMTALFPFIGSAVLHACVAHRRCKEMDTSCVCRHRLCSWTQTKLGRKYS